MRALASATARGRRHARRQGKAQAAADHPQGRQVLRIGGAHVS
jgi:hypothetical protein